MFIYFVFYRYFVNFDVKQGNFSYIVVDYVGNSFVVNIFFNGSIEFMFDDDWFVVSLIGMMDEEKVELFYQVEVLFIVDVVLMMMMMIIQVLELIELDDVGSLVEVSGGVKGVVFMCVFVVFYFQESYWGDSVYVIEVIMIN